MIYATIQKNIVPYEIKYNQTKLFSLKNKESLQLINDSLNNEKFFLFCINDEHNNDDISKEMQLFLENIFTIPSHHEKKDNVSHFKKLFNKKKLTNNLNKIKMKIIKFYSPSNF